MDSALSPIKKHLIKNERFVLGLSIFLSLLILSVGVSLYFPIGTDWERSFRPAALQVLSLQSPYNISTYYSPPWSVLPLLPLAALPEKIGFAINFSLSLAVTAFVAHRLGAKPLAIIILLLSYPVLFMAAYGQIDWLVYLGCILPPQWGLFLVLTKPQISIGIVIFWLIESFREGGIKKVVTVFLPVSLAFIASFLLFGNWLQGGLSTVERGFNASFWPQSIPIGLILLVNLLRHRSKRNALLVSPFLSPYLAPHGWGIALLGLSSSVLEILAASIGIWILRIMTGYFLH